MTINDKLNCYIKEDNDYLRFLNAIKAINNDMLKECKTIENIDRIKHENNLIDFLIRHINDKINIHTEYLNK